MTNYFNLQSDDLKVYVCPNRNEMGKLAADFTIKQIKEKLDTKEDVRIIFASAPSQDEFLYSLTANEDIDWSRIIGFQMDEYIGLSNNSEQSFKRYLKEKLVNKKKFKDFHFIDHSENPKETQDKYQSLIKRKSIDICCLGIGENGHIAFNDPPVADFNDNQTIKKVKLDYLSRQQQVNDGNFLKVEDVPTHALTLTIPTLTSVSTMICVVPGIKKREAVYKVLNDEISTACPATILRRHEDAYLIVDESAYGEKFYEK